MARFLEEMTKKVRARNIAKGRAEGRTETRDEGRACGTSAVWRPRRAVSGSTSHSPATRIKTNLQYGLKPIHMGASTDKRCGGAFHLSDGL